MKKGILLVNLGSIDVCCPKVLAKYLRQFLMDERVIDLPYWKRWLLVHAFIVPFRVPKVIKEYEKLFLAEGSPLLVHSQALTQKVQAILGDDFTVELAMRYQNPSIEKALNNLRSKPIDELVIFPLFPQYASATVGSVHQEVMRLVSTWTIIPNLQFISSFYDHPLFLDCMSQHIDSYLSQQKTAHLVFSFHGLPERHMAQSESYGLGSERGVMYHYQKACRHHASLLAERLQLSPEQHSICFQSRLGKEPWIEPYATDIIRDLAEKGEKNLVICAPSFVADCLETSMEIGEQYRELFLAHGGESFTLVESLNSSSDWAKTLAQLIKGEG